MLVWAGTGLESSGQESVLEASQTAFDRWVTLQESIASEKSDWEVEREYLNEEIRLLQEEIDALTAKQSQLTNETAVLNADLAKLDEENAALEAASAMVEQQLPKLEGSLRELVGVLPPSLQSTIESLVNRIPPVGAATNAGVSERLQVVVGILSQIDRANAQLSVETEVKTTESGEKIQVRVLYLGLAHAWYVSQDGNFAGHGQPTEEGWDWTRDESIADLVARAIAIHDGLEIANYVELPVQHN